ncbi:MAG: ATP-binding protein [Fimbriimonadaceae bacterium]|nr:ATP-binding protein [Chitinophagales bacterium]
MSVTEHLAEQQLLLVSDPNNIVLIEPFIESFRCDNQITDEIYGNMLVAITEAVNNAIVHGNKSDKEKKVKINLLRMKNLVVCAVEDEGHGFDFTNLPDPTAPENIQNTGGRGVFLMKNLSDMVIFSNDGSFVEIQFKL